MISGNLKNEVVRFRISDLYLPDPGAVLAMLHGYETLEGMVLELSDTGKPDGAFAVVQIEGVEQPNDRPAQPDFTGRVNLAPVERDLVFSRWVGFWAGMAVVWRVSRQALSRRSARALSVSPPESVPWPNPASAAHTAADAAYCWSISAAASKHFAAAA